MKNKITKYDFLIVGSGLIGSLMALSLISQKFRVLVIEKKKITPSSYTDNRTLAVNANSRDFLRSINLWDQKSSNSMEIKRILIKTFLSDEELVFQNPNESMGTVVFNKNLLIKAHKSLFKSKSLIDNTTIDLKSLKTNHPIIFNKNKFSFNKIIIAAGKELIAQLEDINHIFGSSKYRAHVGFFKHSNHHNNTAYENFTKEGPLAILPIPSLNNNQSTFIYSTSNKISFSKMQNILNKYFKKTHNKIVLSKKIYEYPINPYLISQKNFLKDLILIGDSFRSIHPVAGQGWNLGIKDIQSLNSTLRTEGINSENFNKIFYARRKLDSYLYFYFTELINKVFDSQTTLTNIIGKICFNSLNKISFLRKSFIKQAMGR